MIRIRITVKNSKQIKTMLSIITKISNPIGRSTKIHPELFQEKRADTPRVDPCVQIYARCKQPGAYDQYRQILEASKNTNKTRI